MKSKVTRKSVLQHYDITIKVPYCNLQNTLAYKSPIAYTCGVYGWNADIYEYSYNIAIVTGYRPFGNYVASSEICSKYEKKAFDLAKSCLFGKELDNAMDDLLYLFIQEILQGSEKA